MPSLKRASPPVSIVLPSDATIVNVEADAQKFSHALSNCGKSRILRIDASQVQDMDTAYLQLVRSCFKSAVNRGMRIEVVGFGDRITQLSKIYGLTWDDPCSPASGVVSL